MEYSRFHLFMTWLGDTKLGRLTVVLLLTCFLASLTSVYMWMFYIALGGTIFATVAIVSMVRWIVNGSK